MIYKVVLSLHLISVISWMAGILYLYRLLVYHAEETEIVVKTRLETMQSKLYRIITLPAMLATLVFGLFMVGLNIELLHQPWFHAKLTLAMAMMASTYFAATEMDHQKAGTSKLSGKRLRLLNEIPTLLMIGIVFLAILKPW